MNTVFVIDEAGCQVLRYIPVRETYGRVFYGGNVRDGGLDHGPHVVHHVGSLLDLLARLATTDGHPYTLQSNFSGKTVHLRPEMRADDIAGVLGIEVQDVICRYGLLVRVHVDKGES